MSTLIQRPQLSRTYAESFQLATNFATAGGTSDNITAVLGSLATADNVSVAVANETAGSQSMGYVLGKEVSIWDTSSKSPFTDGNGNEVYGRITKPAANYILSYYSLVSGVETAYTMPVKNIDFTAIYFFNDLKFPVDAFTRVKAIEVGDDPATRSADQSELLSVTATNTLSALSKTPITGAKVSLNVNGVIYDTVNGGITVSGTAVTWTFTAANGGFDITTSGYTVEAVYKVSA